MSLPTLRTHRLILQPFTLEDAPRVQQLAGAYEVASRTLTIPYPYRDGMAESWIASHVPNWADKISLTLAITLADQEPPPQGVIGAVALTFCWVHRRAELGYWLGMPYWNHGYTTEAAQALVNYGFDELGLNRIEAGHYRRNPASGRVMEKIGMQREGLLRQHLFKWGQFEDRVVYGMLASDRPPAR
jgi:ribosomal-protein-alanine N-acetyltransferase